MKSKTTLDVQGTATLQAFVSPSNIDGFFRSRARTLSPLTPLVRDHARPSQPKASRQFNHAQPHKPQAAKTVNVRIQQESGATRSQKLTVHRSPVQANHTKAHATQHAKTLVRSAVQRPEPSFRKQVNTAGSLQHGVPSLIVPKKSASVVDSHRMVRAQTVERSPLVGHHQAPVSLKPTFTPLAVAPAPVKPPENSEPVHAPAPTPTGNPSPTDIFEHALANAEHFVDLQAQKLHFKKKARRHAASMAAGTLALLVIAAFAAYQNSPGLQLRVASVQAGFSTNMPNFKAAGFAYTGVKTNDGKVMLGFSGPAGHYRLTQQATNLSASDVIQNIGATDSAGTPDYRVVQAGSTTVYRFDNTNATWVLNGKWYTVNGTTGLSDSQVTKLVQNI